MVFQQIIDIQEIELLKPVHLWYQFKLLFIND